MSNKTERASELFSKGYNCAQAVIYAYQDETGLEVNVALKVACGLGAGMGRNGEVCGAVTGGILVLGLRHGRGSQDDKMLTEITYEKTRELMQVFKDKHGSYICRELIDGCNLNSEEGKRQFRDKDMKKLCKDYVQSVVEILEK